MEQFKISDEFYNDQLTIDVAIALLKHVIATNEPITYGGLVRLIGNGMNPRNLDAPLGNLSYDCLQNGAPPISAMVYNKDTGIPGTGFFRYFFPGLDKDE